MIIMLKVLRLIWRGVKHLLGFRSPYIAATIKSKFVALLSCSSLNDKEYDLVFVCPAQGWILEGICKEINRYYIGKTTFCYETKKLPYSKAYFFAHYSLFLSAFLDSSHILNSKNIVFYTHSRDIGCSNNVLSYILNHCHQVFAMSSSNKKLLHSIGVNPKKVTVFFGGADEKLFTRKRKISIPKEVPCIGFCLAFQSHHHHRERKNFDLIIELIKLIDQANVIILGRNWHKYERFHEIQNLSYFRYIETTYEEYPNYYQQMNVFVSVSKLEGGPIPLIEAMMCNVFPVVSNTGFAPDIITHGENGFIFEVDASVDAIYNLVKKALKIDVEVRETIKHLTWESFSFDIQEAIK
jgi:glycosyltransferase involved in cell wall biosynthesis